jgi:arylsulfatase
MLITQGGRFAGWGLYLREGKPVFTMNLLGMERPKWEAAVALSPGRHTLVFDWQMDANGAPFSRGGSGTLSVDGQEVARRSLPRTLPFTFAWDETLDVGLDTGTPVDDSDYQVPFNFTGKLNRIIVDLGESSVTPEALRDFQSQAQKRG